MNNKNIPTVKEMRESGFKVRVLHKRFWREDTLCFTPKYLKNNKDKFLIAQRDIGGPGRSAKGGETVVEITLPDGREARGEAFCSLKDGYNKKTGVSLAVSRALANVN
jgi:hypothetical protein